MRATPSPIAIGAYVLVLIVLALGVKFEARAAVAAGTALLVALGSTVMTFVYAWFLRVTGQTRVRVPTSQRFWTMFAVAMGCAAAAAFALIPDSTVAGFLAGLALYALQSSMSPTEPKRLGS